MSSRRRARCCPRDCAPMKRWAASSSVEYFERLVGTHSLPSAEGEHHQAEYERARTNTRLAVITIDGALGGAPHHQGTGQTRRGLQGIGAPNDKMHPALVGREARITKRSHVIPP